MKKVAEHIFNLMLKQRLSLDSHPHQSLNSTWLPRFCAKKTAGTGIFTSGVVATAEGSKIALFLTGQQHPGENSAEVLKRRAAELPDSDVECAITETYQVVSGKLPGAWKKAVRSDPPLTFLSIACMCWRP